MRRSVKTFVAVTLAMLCCGTPAVRADQTIAEKMVEQLQTKVDQLENRVQELEAERATLLATIEQKNNPAPSLADVVNQQKSQKVDQAAPQAQPEVAAEAKPAIEPAAVEEVKSQPMQVAEQSDLVDESLTNESNEAVVENETVAEVTEFNEVAAQETAPAVTEGEAEAVADASVEENAVADADVNVAADKPLLEEAAVEEAIVEEATEAVATTVEVPQMAEQPVSAEDAEDIAIAEFNADSGVESQDANQADTDATADVAADDANGVELQSISVQSIDKSEEQARANSTDGTTRL